MDEIRRSVWAALSAWIVTVTRRVLREEMPPDPDGVTASAGAWRVAVDDLVDNPIRNAVGAAYATVLGSEFRWEQQPFVTSYLAQVKNRLVGIPDEVFDLVTSQVAVGVNLGEGIPDLSARVDDILSLTKSERWPNRATVIARTETIAALNAGKFDAFRVMAKDEGGSFEKVWLATSGDRTRRTHRRAGGQRVPLDDPFIVGGFPLMFPGDPFGPAQEVIQCRCDILLVEQGEQVDMGNREFREP